MTLPNSPQQQQEANGTWIFLSYSQTERLHRRQLVKLILSFPAASGHWMGDLHTTQTVVENSILTSKGDWQILFSAQNDHVKICNESCTFHLWDCMYTQLRINAGAFSNLWNRSTTLLLKPTSLRKSLVTTSATSPFGLFGFQSHYHMQISK